MVYEELKKAARGSLGAKVGGSGELSSAQISVMGAASKLVASIATYPSQVKQDAFLLVYHANLSCTYDTSWISSGLPWATAFHVCMRE